MRTSNVKTSLIAMVVVLFAALAPASSAQAATAKLGSTCKKAGLTAKVGLAQLVCKKNARGKLVWQKYVESADCKQAKAQYATQLKAYEDILAKIAQARAAAGSITGTDADVLRKQIDATEESVRPLKVLVDQLSALSIQICKLG